MDEGGLAQFVAITGASTTTATQYLELAENNVEGAIELFFANDGAPLDQPDRHSQAPPVPPDSTRPQGHRQLADDGIVDLGSDEEYQPPVGGDDIQVTGSRSRRNIGSIRTEAALHTPPVATPPVGDTMDDDEAMARRLQEELYGGPSGGGNAPALDIDEEGYRAPMQRTTETLVGPESFDPSNPEEMRAAVMEQMMARRQPRPTRDRPGIFNQQTNHSIWNQPGGDAQAHRENLARATGGASESSSKANTLAEMYRPPFELMSRLQWDDARTEGKENMKWILVNIQDPSIFDCQLLNRDIWKNPGIMETVRENFIFMQYGKDDQRGNQYTQYYFQNKDVESLYPHIAIVDPRTGEQVKKWSGPPAPKAPDFLMQLHEFLDRYSLRPAVKNPVAKRKPEVKKESQLDRLTEDQQMEMAMKASLASSSTGQQGKDDDPDDLTRSLGNIGESSALGARNAAGAGAGAQAQAQTARGHETTTMNGAAGHGHVTPSSPPAPAPTSALSAISSSNPHTEPAASEPGTTRIQFRHPTGRVVRRFALSDRVRRLYEWLKASPLEGQAGKDFELVFMQKNLIDSLDESVEQAGLKNGTVMVEIIEQEGDGDGDGGI